MPILRSATLIGALLTGAALASPVAAEDALATPSFKATSAKPASAKPKGAKSTAAASTRERRPGELEGFESGVPGSPGAKRRAPADAIGERRLPDGGLPLPNARESSPGMGQAPVGFDKNGNIGGMFKF